MAALAERLEVPGPVIRRVVIHMGAGQEHAHLVDREVRRPPIRSRQALKRLPSTITPRVRFRIPPPTISEVQDDSTVRAKVSLAAAFGTAKTNDGREGPVVKFVSKPRNGRIGSAFELGCPPMAVVKCGSA